MALQSTAGRGRRYSLRRRLIATTVGSSVIIGLVTTAIVLAIAWKETSEAFDDTLEEGAKLALALGEEAARGNFARRGKGERNPQMRIDYQILSRDGRVVRRGDDAPAEPFVDPGSRDDQFYDVRHDGQWWRVYVLRHDELGFSVQVGQEWDERVGLIGDVLESLAWPLVALWLLLGLVNWWLIRRLVAPLARMTEGIGAKSPDDLSPMADDDPATEVSAVVQALNQLLGRLSRALEGERRFTADAAHELRTPLAALASRIQLMQRSHQALGSSALAADLQRLRDDVARSTVLVENLLQLARLDPQSADATAMERLDLDLLFEEVVRACQSAAAARHVEVVVENRLDRDDSARSGALRAADGPAGTGVIGNRAWLFSALRNLLDNAIRHGAERGRVEIIAARRGETTEIIVRDDGPGVIDADRERLTRRFYRVVGTEAQGSGLGLSIVARVAELHGASLRLGSGLGGRGLAVTLVFAPRPR